MGVESQQDGRKGGTSNSLAAERRQRASNGRRSTQIRGERILGLTRRDIVTGGVVSRIQCDKCRRLLDLG